MSAITPIANAVSPVLGNEHVSKPAEVTGEVVAGGGAAMLLYRRMNAMPIRSAFVPGLVALGGLGLAELAREARGDRGLVHIASDGVDSLVDRAAPVDSQRRDVASIGLRVLGAAAIGGAILLNPRRAGTEGSIERWFVNGATKAPADAKRILSLERAALAFGGLKAFSVGAGLGSDSGVTGSTVDTMVDSSDPAKSLDHAATSLEGDDSK